MNLNQLRKLNRHIKIKGISNLSFKKYGKIVTGYDFTDMIKYMEKWSPIPEEGCIRIPSVEALEELSVSKNIQDYFYGELPIQIGYFNGVNSKLNCLEFHKSNEIILALTDIIIFLGKVQDISDNYYELKRAEAFFVPEGVAIEIYSSTMHSIPCRMQANGFRCILICLRGSDTSLRLQNDNKGLLCGRNKWILVNSQSKYKYDKDMKPGLIGEDIEIFIS
jgi:hypothetical protein